MRAYSADAEEARLARDLVKDWHGEGLLTAEQYQRIEQETVCEFRRTNIFLRLTLFLFTVILVAASIGLFFVVGGLRERSSGWFLLLFAGLTYAAAEFAVSEAKVHRYGIEEALAFSSAGLLFLGLHMLFDASHTTTFLLPAIGTVACIWIWHRFGLPYAPLAAMLFAAWLPSYFTTAPLAQHLIIATLFGIGLAWIATARPHHRFTFLDSEYAIAEALLWLGIYLAINLQITSLRYGWWSHSWNAGEFPRAFYWSTWVLTWLIPPLILARGLRLKDRLVIAAGGITAIATFVTNKSYLGWQRHTWDPMLLGALLIGIALLLRRWLANAPGGVRHGFTAQRLSGKDKQWMGVGAATISLATAPGMPAPREPEVRFGGGDSGGGGATSDF